MGFHRFDAEVQSRRDGFVTVSFSEQLDHLALTRRQALYAGTLPPMMDLYASL